MINSVLDRDAAKGFVDAWGKTEKYVSSDNVFSLDPKTRDKIKANLLDQAKVISQRAENRFLQSDKRILATDTSHPEALANEINGLVHLQKSFAYLDSLAEMLAKVPEWELPNMASVAEKLYAKAYSSLTKALPFVKDSNHQLKGMHMMFRGFLNRFVDKFIQPGSRRKVLDNMNNYLFKASARADENMKLTDNLLVGSPKTLLDGKLFKDKLNALHRV